MANRRVVVDRRDDRDHEDGYRRKEPARDPPPSRTRQQLNEYFIDGEGIHREVLQMEICKYLGAEATCRPGDYNGRQGYKIKALRPFTPEMLYDLKTASKDYISENKERSLRRYQEIPYQDSATRRRLEDVTLPPSSSGGYPPSGNMYPSMDSGPVNEYPPSSLYPSGQGYTASTSPYPPSSGPGPMPSGYTSNPGDRGNYPPNYTYEQPPREYPNQGYPSYAPAPGGYGEQQRPRDTQLPPGYVYRTVAPDAGGRGAPMDDRYYESQMSMAPAGSYGAPGVPYRNQPSGGYDQGSSRDPHGSRQPPAESYTGYRRR